MMLLAVWAAVRGDAAVSGAAGRLPGRETDGRSDWLRAVQALPRLLRRDARQRRVTSRGGGGGR